MEAIVAINALGYIGLDGKLPWPHNPADMKHFRKVTDGKTMIVGRVTYENMPKIELGNRKLVVFSRYLDLPRPLDDTMIVIGGAQTYINFIHFIKVWHVSIINDKTKGDMLLTLKDIFSFAKLAKAEIRINHF